MLFTTKILGLALTSALLLLPSSLASPEDRPSLLEYRSWLPENTCICPYDPLIPEDWLECVGRCAQHEKRVHLSTRDLSHHTRRVCVCPEDAPNCPPCNPPYPPNCPQCWYNAFGTVVCPLCPWPPVTSTKPPKPTITFCPLSRKYCRAQPDGTYKCPGCGPIPIDVEVTDVAGAEPTIAPAK
ncbi:hypothetical protein L486_00383 [Kwoniella mangroviensis CBS 10435]|uniref:Uncharacterized protein n=1 Tax=Kwoniella mangroviensis CBS 10435 TaxID=1331196 RepID=A0A1B9IYZ5_9TREE|nr:hypothetical protein L486_00383 [Kwoniella mangroviensis CBS 10435]